MSKPRVPFRGRSSLAALLCFSLCKSDSLVPLVVKVTTAAHVGFGRQKHELLEKTQAALKSPAVVRNDENIPNLAWIYNYAESKFECLYWNFSIPIQPPRRELVWIICRDCVCVYMSEWVWFFFLFLFFKCRSQMLHNETFVESQNHNKWSFLRSICTYQLTIRTPALCLLTAGSKNNFQDSSDQNLFFVSHLPLSSLFSFFFLPVNLFSLGCVN